MWRKTVIQAMADVEAEWRAAARGIALFKDACQADPTILGGVAVTWEDVRRCSANLEDTYLVRLFAVFEENLRDVWEQAHKRTTAPKTVDLLNGTASRQHVKTDDLDHAHAVREYRNRIVHGGDASALTLSQARSNLCTFFGWMPKQW